MQDYNKTPNYFVRIFIALLCLLLGGMVLFRFLTIEPKGEINSGLLILIGFLIVLVLAESFDNFSVGKLISISRDVRKKEVAIEKLEKQNSSLLSQLISFSSSQSQRQSSTTVQGNYYAAPTVEKATEAEIAEKQFSEPSAPSSPLDVPTKVRMNWEKAEEIALNKFLQQRSIHPSNVITEAKLVTQFHGIDPISNIQPIFDGYIKEAEHESFIEIRVERMVTPMYRDRLYVMLSKINYYRTSKNIDAHLDILVLKIPGEEPRNGFPSPELFFHSFEPAIVSGLLKIQKIEFTEAEAASCRMA